METVDEPFDIIFLDPPYTSGFYEDALDLIAERKLLSEDGVVVAEHLYDKILSDNYRDLTRIKCKKYGTIGVDVFCVR